VRTLRDLRRARQTPEAIVLGPLLYLQLQDEALSYLWNDPMRKMLFDVPLEIDDREEGCAVRIRSAESEGSSAWPIRVKTATRATIGAVSA
jgi:hypothetical protein